MLDLEAIELIKQLKARYFRFLDTANFDGLQTVFTADATAHFIGGDYEFELAGWDALKDFYQQSFTTETFGMHTGHHPEIDVDGETATGIWYLHDIFLSVKDNHRVMGSALYRDRYVKSDGVWRIAHTGYERLYEEVSTIGDDVRITARPVK